ncbi:MAG: cytochrome-c peroxidase [Pirellulaceae bacterium]
MPHLKMVVACISLVLLSLAVPVRAQEFTAIVPKGLIEPDIPRNNKLTRAKVLLGEKLFSDMRLSSNGRMSCATCHQPDQGFAEGRQISIASTGESMRRNAPPVFNVGFGGLLNWDGRFRSLEEQIEGVFSPYGDMGIDMGDVVSRISDDPDYVSAFLDVFGREPTSGDVKAAIASYQRSLVSAYSRFDKFLFANDDTAISPDERDGYELFIGKASCISCHDVFHPSTNNLGGELALFTDHRFHNLGVGYKGGRMLDTGRYEVTRDRHDWGTFKTPTLRNVWLTAPYMHDGSMESLEAVVDFYNEGGTPNPNLSPGIRPLFLSKAERGKIVKFLGSLTDERLAAKRTIVKYVPDEPVRTK